MTPEQMEYFIRGGLDKLAADPTLTPRQAVDAWAAEAGLRRVFWSTANPIDKRSITRAIKDRYAARHGK